MDDDLELRYQRNWRRFQELMRLAHDAGRKQCLAQNPNATEEEMKTFLKEWWGRRKKDEEIPLGWTIHTEWRH